MSKKSKWTIGAKVWLLSGLLLLNLAVIGGIGYLVTSVLGARLDKVALNDMPANRHAILIDMMHDGIRANVFHSIIISGSPNKSEVTEVQQESADFAKTMREQVAALQKTELPERIVKELQVAAPMIEEYIQEAQKIVPVALSGNIDQALKALPNFQTKFEELEKSLGEFGDDMGKYADQTAEDAQILTDRANFIFISAIIVGLIISLTTATLVTRNLQKTLKQIIKHLGTESATVTTSAHSLSQAADALANSTTQQATALQETAASVDEITAMVNKTSDNAKQLEATAQLSQESASRGQKSITQMLSSMEIISQSHGKIMAQVEEGNRKITEIVKVIGEIGNKTKVINDIVFQTKLLSFNASVEAARAGENGKGFAVVAEEVGSLAQMSGNAAKDISDMLTSSIEKVEGIVTESKRSVEVLITEGKHKLESGTEVAKQCGSALEEIVKHSGDVGSMISEITTAIHEQNQGIHEISKALQMLDSATHENSSTSKQTSETSQSLLGQAQRLGTIVSNLVKMVGSKNENSVDEHDSITARQPEETLIDEGAEVITIADLNGKSSSSEPSNHHKRAS